jgi:predicted signal transduction protein with EAL and GGDEF domain
MLLQHVAERLTACVREGDTIARIGGDEFVVLLENLSEQLFDAAAQTEFIGNKILTSLNQPYQLDTHRYNSTSSIGATLFDGNQSDEEEMLKQADIAMYDAKEAGRNTLHFFDPVMQDKINNRAEMERDLRNALENNEFQLYYQVQVDNTGHTLGAEALIRWHHPERGIVSPIDFIPLAEETGLIIPIGLWVLETACAQLKAWNKSARTFGLTISINVSAKQIQQIDFEAEVQAAVQRHAINPTLLKLELTESMLVDNIENIIVSMAALQAVGVRFELDDFGTGYSSLQYLKQLPLYQLKIDQSFVREITSNSSDQAIVRTIIAMAESLKLKVIAEGVETEGQLTYLRNYGCNHFQGYFFGKPVPIEDFDAKFGKS